MKAISLWQPWATAIALGLKRNETRDWPATSGGQRYRGWLAICAAKTQKDPIDKEPLSIALQNILEDSPESALAFNVFFPTGIWQFERLPFGKVVAIVWLQQCVETEKAAPPIVEKIWATTGRTAGPGSSPNAGALTSRSTCAASKSFST